MNNKKDQKIFDQKMFDQKIFDQLLFQQCLRKIKTNKKSGLYLAICHDMDNTYLSKLNSLGYRTDRFLVNKDYSSYPYIDVSWKN